LKADFPLALKLLSTACAFGAALLLTLWLGRRGAAAAAEGRRMLADWGVPAKVEIKESPLLARAANFGVLFLPQAKRWQEQDFFGVAATLDRWEVLIVKAGLRSRLTPLQFLAGAMFSALFVGALMAVLALQLLGPKGALLLGLPTGTLAGFYLPSVLLTGLAAARVSLMEKRLPFATEFMLLAMEANAAFPAAMQVYCDQTPDDPLADEFRIVLMDIEGGLSAEAAMQNLQQRVGSESLDAFVLAVATGLETGQPLKEVLETQADATRQRRFQSAEEIAKTASTRAVFPLFVVVLAVLLLLLGPMIMKMMRSDSVL
jgi:Flp pilus assembly protein TadB